jgi:lysozyme family protein
MPSLRELLDDLIGHEGGFVDDPDDRGGTTNWGISLRYAKTVGDRDGDGKLDLDLDSDGDVDGKDIKLLTRQQAEDLYIRDFLKGPNIDKAPDSIIPILFDCAVNHGPRVGIRFLQEVINMAGFGPISCDGILGPTTLRWAQIAAREMGPFLVNAIVEQRIAFYKMIIKNNPSQAKYRRGWMNRAESFRVEIH